MPNQDIKSRKQIVIIFEPPGDFDEADLAFLHHKVCEFIQGTVCAISQAKKEEREEKSRDKHLKIVH